MDMAYLDEEEVWKCMTHPSKRRNPYGVCPRCLRDKLSTLCPDCASSLPCSCSSSDASASFSSRSSSAVLDRSEPSFRRSRSVATLNPPSFLSSRSKFSGRDSIPPPPKTGSSFWGKFRGKKGGTVCSNMDENASTMMRKSRSVAVGHTKGRGWSRYLPSPMKAFGVHGISSLRSTLYRG